MNNRRTTSTQTGLYPLTVDRPTYQTPRDKGQGWAPYLEHARTGIHNITIAPAMMLRRNPTAAKEESTQIITDILYMHAKAPGDAAIALGRLLLALHKILRIAPTNVESEQQPEHDESKDEARKPRFVQHRCHMCCSGRWEALVDPIATPERTTSRDAPTQQRWKQRSRHSETCL